MWKRVFILLPIFCATIAFSEKGAQPDHPIFAALESLHKTEGRTYYTKFSLFYYLGALDSKQAEVFRKAFITEVVTGPVVLQRPTIIEGDAYSRLRVRQYLALMLLSKDASEIEKILIDQDKRLAPEDKIDVSDIRMMRTLWRPYHREGTRVFLRLSRGFHYLGTLSQERRDAVLKQLSADSRLLIDKREPGKPPTLRELISWARKFGRAS